MPSGVPGPMVPIIWFLEFFSMVIRVLTLAVRLYGNMLAGHMVLAVFSLATTVFLQQAVFSMDFVTALPAVAWFVLLVLMYAMECLVAFLQAGDGEGATKLLICKTTGAKDWETAKTVAKSVICSSLLKAWMPRTP